MRCWKRSARPTGSGAGEKGVLGESVVTSLLGSAADKQDAIIALALKAGTPQWAMRSEAVVQRSSAMVSMPKLRIAAANVPYGAPRTSVR